MLSLCTSRPQTVLFRGYIFYWNNKPVFNFIEAGQPTDLIFPVKIVAVVTFFYTGRKKSLFLYNFVDHELIELLVDFIC